MSIENLTLLPQTKSLLANSLSSLEGSPKVSDQYHNPYLQQVYQNKLLRFYRVEEEKVLFLITNWPGERFVAGVIKERLILFLLEKGFDVVESLLLIIW